MRSPGVKVPRALGETVRRSLRDAGLLRGDVRPIRRGESLVFPVHHPPTELPAGAEVVEEEFESASPDLPKRYQDLLADLPAAERRKLPRSFDVVGDIVLVRISAALTHRRRRIGRALLGFVPGARRVGWDRGVKGEQRRRRINAIAGHGGWKTSHRENGLSIAVRLDKAYFSPRLGREHRWVADQVRPGERVLDLCCGVGPFSLLIAKEGRASSITGVDMNPHAIRLFRENLRRVPHRIPVRAVGERLSRFLPRATPADRTIFNLPHGGVKYLASVGTVVAPGGTLHYYEMTERNRQSARPRELAEAMRSAEGWEVTEWHRVHPYSPRSDLCEFSLRHR